jgi:hypothetical protein
VRSARCAIQILNSRTAEWPLPLLTKQAEQPAHIECWHTELGTLARGATPASLKHIKKCGSRLPPHHIYVNFVCGCALPIPSCKAVGTYVYTVYVDQHLQNKQQVWTEVGKC